MKIPLKIFIVFLFISLAQTAFGASIVISSSGNGAYILQGVGLADVCGIDATISYDTALLSSPRITQGELISGAMMVANPNTPGIIRIIAVKTSPITGSGVLARINFNTTAGSGGKIFSLNAKIINGNKVQLAVQTQVFNPADANTDSSDTVTGSSGTVATNATGGLESKYLGPAGVILTSESGEVQNRKPAPETYSDQPVSQRKEIQTKGMPLDALSETQNSGVPKPTVSADRKFVVYKSVLEGFREFSGGKTLKAFKALFDGVSMSCFRQEPAVALSDGKTRVKVFIQLPAAGKEAPNFMIKGAKFISLKLDGLAWVVEALPDEKVYDAAITVMENGSITQVPLTVAPPVDVQIEKTIICDEAGVALFLKERGTEKAPRFDLNGDGVRNYMDDYIFTANYIVKRNSKTDVKKYVKNTLTSG